MRIVYLDAAGSGIAGDMLFAALLDAGADWQRVLSHLQTLPVDGWHIDYSRVMQHGFAAADIAISYTPQHQHRHLADILALIDQAQFPPRAREIACRAFELLAEAEAAAHGSSRDQIHFHEVGALDSILDICGVALAIDALNVQQVYASPLPLGSGFVDCAHGRLPVPAPAVLNLLADWPLCPSDISGELVTPTGAALLRAMQAKPLQPSFTLLATGQGAGKRQLPRPNFLRAFYGEAAEEVLLPAGLQQDEVDVICANIDDSSGEILAALWEKAFALGAKDMCYMPLLMKKGRPAWQLQLLVPGGQAPRFAALMFAETSTIGFRYHTERRLNAPRRLAEVSTVYGPVLVKLSGSNNIAPEAESVMQAARQHDVPFKQVFYAAIAAAQAAAGSDD